MCVCVCRVQLKKEQLRREGKPLTAAQKEKDLKNKMFLQALA